MATARRTYGASFIPRGGTYGPQYMKYTQAAFGGTTGTSVVRGHGQAGKRPVRPRGKSHRTGVGFLAQMEALGRYVEAKTEFKVRQAAFAALAELVMRTPVKTGRARINWQVSLGGPKVGDIQPPNTRDRETNANVAAAAAMISGSNVIKAFKAQHKSIFIGNATPYIFGLEAGTSQQAPAGMTSFAIQAARNALRKGSS